MRRGRFKLPLLCIAMDAVVALGDRLPPIAAVHAISGVASDELDYAQAKNGR